VRVVDREAAPYFWADSSAGRDVGDVAFHRIDAVTSPCCRFLGQLLELALEAGQVPWLIASSRVRHLGAVDDRGVVELIERRYRGAPTSLK